MKLSDSNTRLVTATLGGSVLAGLVGVAFIGFVFGLPLVLGVVHPMDRINDLRRLPDQLAVGAIGGAILGGLAVFASHSQRRGVSLPLSFAVIAASGGIARFWTESPYKVAEPPLINSYLAALIAAVFATAVLVSIGYIRGKMPDAQQRTTVGPLRGRRTPE